MAGNGARRRRLARSGGVPAHRHRRIVNQAVQDATQLAADVRELDPTEIWGRLAYRHATNPDRLLALCIALAAMVPIDDHSVDHLLAWTDSVARSA